jgi:hypothetical protein
MIINLPAHSLHLLADSGCHFVLTGSVSLISFLRQHSQRSFQSMRQVAGFRQCPLDHLLTMFQ